MSGANPTDRRPCRCGKPGRCRLCWLAANDERYMRLWGILPPRDARCVHLLTRDEFRPGCNGMKCRWSCGQNLPAVPADFCQSCRSYEGEEGAGWLS